MPTVSTTRIVSVMMIFLTSFRFHIKTYPFSEIGVFISLCGKGKKVAEFFGERMKKCEYERLIYRREFELTIFRGNDIIYQDYAWKEFSGLPEKFTIYENVVGIADSAVFGLDAGPESKGRMIHYDREN